MAKLAKETLSGGRALKEALHVARAKAGIKSDIAMARHAGVSYDTLMNWYSERTVPRPHELKKVATALGASYAEFMEAYEGRANDPVPLDAAIRELVAELRMGRAHEEERTLVLIRSIESLAMRLREDCMEATGSE